MVRMEQVIPVLDRGRPMEGCTATAETGHLQDLG